MPPEDADPFPVAVPDAAMVEAPPLDTRDLEQIPTTRTRSPAQIAAFAKAQAARKAQQVSDRAIGAKQPGAKGPKARTPEPEKPDDAKLRRDAFSTLKRWRAEVGTGALVIAPVPATYVSRTPDEVLESAVVLAGRNAKVLKMLAGGGDVLAAIVILRWCAGLGVAVGVQTDRFAPDSAVSRNFGIDEIVTDLAREGYVTVEDVEREVASDHGDLGPGDDAEDRRAPAAVAVV